MCLSCQVRKGIPLVVTALHMHGRYIYGTIGSHPVQHPRPVSSGSEARIKEYMIVQITW
jgi:hypothetical protein